MAAEQQNDPEQPGKSGKKPRRLLGSQNSVGEAPLYIEGRGVRRPCGARTRSGGVCKGIAVTGSTRCRLHGGGHELRGPANPAYRHGRYSKWLGGLSGILREAAERRLEDPSYGSLRERIALTDARFEELLVDLAHTQADGTATYALVGQTVHSLREDFEAMRVSDAMKKLEHLEKIIATGMAQDIVWKQIARNQEERRRLTETEGKNLERLQQTMTADQLKLFLTQIVVIMADEIDRESLKKVTAKFQEKFLGGGPSATKTANAVEGKVEG